MPLWQSGLLNKRREECGTAAARKGSMLNRIKLYFSQVDVLNSSVWKIDRISDYKQSEAPRLGQSRVDGGLGVRVSPPSPVSFRAFQSLGAAPAFAASFSAAA